MLQSWVIWMVLYKARKIGYKWAKGHFDVGTWTSFGQQAEWYSNDKYYREVVTLYENDINTLGILLGMVRFIEKMQTVGVNSSFDPTKQIMRHQ